MMGNMNKEYTIIYMTAARHTRKKSGLPRCKNGTRRNKKTGKCVKYSRVTASKAVSQLFEQSPATQQSNYLSAICSDSNFCTTFGLETDRLATFFQFPGFEYVIGMRQIAHGYNGFVNELIYEKRGYKINTILKTPLNNSIEIDNMYYEGYIGFKYINKFAMQFPCFLKTLGIYQYLYKPDFLDINTIANDDPNTYVDLIKQLRDGAILTPIIIKPGEEYNAAFSCINRRNFALLIEYVDRPIKFYHFFSRIVSTAADVFCELPQIFFQIYAVLATLADKRLFTHYDLHDENILLYPIPNGRTITMTYTNAVGGNTITFNTRYVVKIVDYGRCFVPESAAIRKKICVERACAPNCGADYGYIKILSDKSANEQNKYIHSATFNQSIDLKVVSKQRPWFRAFVRTPAAKAAGITLDSAYFKLLQKVVYMGKNGVPHSAIKTPAATKFHFTGTRDIAHIPDIWTVQEMYWALFYYLQCKEYLSAYTALTEIPSAGAIICDLKYSKRPLVFTFENKS